MGDCKKYDRIIIGAGLYGLYAALYCGSRGMSVAVIELDNEAFGRATYINQARVHMGYHYPRSLTTAVKSAGYFKRFEEDYEFCIHKKFDQVYATSDKFSWTNATQFIDFCKAAGIRCDEVSPTTYFKDGMCDGAFLTEEYTYDAHILRDYYMDEIGHLDNIDLIFWAKIEEISKNPEEYNIAYRKDDGLHNINSSFVLNATYASVNQIIDMVYPDETFNIKYELCEIILCKPSDTLRDTGITIMDGPFFSIMPFGKTGLHSLTSVTFTPHKTSYGTKPEFPCQMEDNNNGDKNRYQCTTGRLGNCNECSRKPESAWPYMSHLADKYLREEYQYTYDRSLFSMKPILKNSEVDDSRPTAIRRHGDGTGPVFISVLSGKINTVYDLDEYLD